MDLTGDNVNTGSAIAVAWKCISSLLNIAKQKFIDLGSPSNISNRISEDLGMMMPFDDHWADWR